MPQVFHPSMNAVARATVLGGAVLLSVGVAIVLTVLRSPYFTEVGVVREQPVPFSHEHHVGEVGLDCRYCHTSVETAATAGVPPTATCMNCHSQLLATSALLAPVRESFASGRPLRWTRVHDLPDFVYFDHSIHVNKGVACRTCHGRVDEMPLMWREHPLFMQWCLDCHWHPESKVGPRQDVFAMREVARPENVESVVAGSPAVKSKTNCYTCHR